MGLDNPVDNELVGNALDIEATVTSEEVFKARLLNEPREKGLRRVETEALVQK